MKLHLPRIRIWHFVVLPPVGMAFFLTIFRLTDPHVLVPVPVATGRLSRGRDPHAARRRSHTDAAAEVPWDWAARRDVQIPPAMGLAATD